MNEQLNDVETDETHEGTRREVMMGNHAASTAVELARTDVISAYPITPQTQVVEKLSEKAGSGDLDARFLTVESEHSAMATCIGASVTGARSFTATSSQGLALMHEMLHWAAGSRLPIVMVNVNRAMAAPWSIWSDQNDSISQRDTGWMQIYCESNQEVLDSILMAYRVAEEVLMPCMVIEDAFILSHTSEPVEVPSQELVDEYLPEYEHPHAIKPGDPKAIGGIAKPDEYFQFRRKMQKAMEEALDLFEKEVDRFEEMFGRRWAPVEQFMMDDAETVLVTSGSVSSTVKYAVHQIRKTTDKNVGVLRIRNLRPFPAETIREILHDRTKVAVLDRNLSFGHSGVFYQEIKAALANEENRPKLFGYVWGLGGKDVRPEDVREILQDLKNRDQPIEVIFWEE